MVNHNIPTQWKEFCGKSKAWCDGFQKAVEKANEKEADPKLEAVLKDIGGVTHSANSQGVPTKSENDDSNHNVNPKNPPGIILRKQCITTFFFCSLTGIDQSPLWPYIAGYVILILFSIFIIGLCCTKHCSKMTRTSKDQNSKNSKTNKKIKTSKNSKPSKGKKASSSKAKNLSAKTSRKRSNAKSSKKSVAKSKSNNRK